jgi:D-tyrosyl-tRNA(Tyr) deacylase
MKAVVQRVSAARVLVEGAPVGAIGRGMLILLGVLRGDGPAEAQRLAERIATFRFFPDEHDRMNRSALDEGLAALVVSQFTLAADGRKGRRPSFDRAAPPAEAEALYERFVAVLRELGLRVETGRFGARMAVELANDGPVTFVLDEAPEAAAGGGGRPLQALA